MTRKRYIKLLMAAGYSRNEANQLAEWAVESGLSYRTAYRFVSTYFPTGFKKIAEALERWLSGIEKVVAGMCRLFGGDSA